MLSEQEALICHAQSGDRQALDVLVKENYGMIGALAGRLFCEWVSREELVQAGILGLLHAIARYDVSRGAKLMTFAAPWILGEMRRAIRQARKNEYSLDQTGNEDEYSLYDVICGDGAVNLGHIDLRLAISQLNQDEQMVICLRYYRDKTQKEAAVLLGKSQTQISRIERRALDALHAMLN